MFDASIRPIDSDGDETGIEISVNSVLASYEAVRMYVIDDEDGLCVSLTADEAKCLADYLLGAVAASGAS